MKKSTTLMILLIIALVAAEVTIAQRSRFRGRSRGGGYGSYGAGGGRNGVPDWELEKDFEDDVFTFVRVKYNSFRRWGKWATDYPDADLNFSYRLQQLTSLKVNPDGKILELTDPTLFDYPFIYMIEPGELEFAVAEVDSLRRYLLNGGFMMVDDFWGEYEWENFYREIKRVFPDREPRELELEHAIFNNVYKLDQKPQIPSIGAFRGGYRTERYDATEAHYKGIFDDKGRMMVVICHNTDLGDGWEREGENRDYFKQYSEKFSYPLGINIIFYAMTH